MIRVVRTGLALWLSLVMGVVAEKIPCELDALVEVASNWSMTPEQLEKKFTQGERKKFSWLTKDKSRAKFTRRVHPQFQVDLTLFGGKVPVEEVIVDFHKGKLNLVTFSVYNRADAGDITSDQFLKLYKTSAKEVHKRLKVKPSVRKADKQQGLQTEGFAWNSKLGVALLEHNAGALSGNKEYLRLRISRKGAKGGLAASMTNSRGGASVRFSSLKHFVEEDRDGNVFIGQLPMVDQGDKGYCVVASVQRLFEHFGIGADMHQIAEVAEADPDQGTSTLLMAKSLDKIDYRFKTRLKILAMRDYNQRLTQVEVKKGEYYVGKDLSKKRVMKMIYDSIDDGLPILWSLELGRFPEKPNLNPQTAGGHMRLIIGYNKKQETLIFSDSWGAGHEFKTMQANHAYRATTGLFVLKPTVN